MVDITCAELDKVYLKINTLKSSYIVFRHSTREKINFSINIQGCDIKPQKTFKYLGINLSEDLSLKEDVNRVTNAFLRQFNGIYSKFYYCEEKVIFHLVKTYATSFYGVETWYDIKSFSVFHRTSVAYHKAVKKITGMNMWASNHDACEATGWQQFRHLHAKRILSFFLKLIVTRSPCLKKYNFFFRYLSVFSRRIKEYFEKEYSVDIFCNDVDALYARIDFVQRTEERSSYLANLAANNP